MMHSVQLYQLTPTGPHSTNSWEAWGADPRTVVQVNDKGATTATGPDGESADASDDCIVYPSAHPTVRAVMARKEDGTPLPGTFRLGPNPGYCKEEGVQDMAWYRQRRCSVCDLDVLSD